MNIKLLSTPGIIPIAALLGLSIAIMFMATPAQAGISIHFGYGHSYGYNYGYPSYYGLHSYSRPYGYGRHHYSYGHRYGGYGYRTPYSSDYGYSSTPDYRDRSYDRGGDNINSTSHGWFLLSNNQAAAALTDFGRQAQATPSKGGPKVGYALAAADLGQLDKGVWAMRRALRTDPSALHYVTLDRHLDAKVEQIIGQYEKKLAYSARDANAAFMLASLHYLRRDMKSARTNIDQAILARHVNSSTQNLRALIDKER